MRTCLNFFLLCCAFWLGPAKAQQPAAVATPNPYATEAAAQVLTAGGTAADAFIAAALMLTLTEPQSSGIGGGFFATYYDASSKKIYTLDAREEAPEKLDSAAFKDLAAFFPFAQGSGAAVGVPGAADGFALLSSRFGRLPPKIVAAPAISGAEQGFVVTPRLAESLLQDAELSCKAIGVPRMAIFPATRSLYFKPLRETPHPKLRCHSDGYYRFQPVGAGAVLKNPDYARLLRLLSEKGYRAFYSPEIRRAIVSTINTASPGHPDGQVTRAYLPVPSPMTEEDLLRYRAVWREPIVSTYRGHDGVYLLYGPGPPSSGTMIVAETLQVLDDPRSLKREHDISRFGPIASGQAYGASWLLVHAMRLAFADRNVYMADPDFVPEALSVLPGLLHPQYARLRDKNFLSIQDLSLFGIARAPQKEKFCAGGFCRKGPNPWNFTGTHRSQKSACLRPGAQPESGTSHISIADAFGNIISATITIEGRFGNGMVVPGYGFMLNNELTDFSLNALTCNSIEPGTRLRASALDKTSDSILASRTLGAKRPRSSMAPLIIFRLDSNTPLDTRGLPDEKKLLPQRLAEIRRPYAAMGASGGPTIPGSVLTTFLNLAEHDLTLQQAVALPRLYDFNDGKIYLEPPLFADPALRIYLGDKGFADVQNIPPIGGVQAIAWKNGKIDAAADPRREGTVAFIGK